MTNFVSFIRKLEGKPEIYVPKYPLPGNYVLNRLKDLCRMVIQEDIQPGQNIDVADYDGIRYLVDTAFTWDEAPCAEMWYDFYDGEYVHPECIEILHDWNEQLKGAPPF